MCKHNIINGDCTMITRNDAIKALNPTAGFTTSGGEIVQWDSTDPQPTEDEINAKIAELEVAEPFRLLREVRNKLIAETDWTQLKDIDLDIIRERNWKNYRQALRDLPSKSTPKLDSNGYLDMSSVNWPDKPSS